MDTIILCGGKGTRAYPHTIELPKPLLLVGEVPILSHVMGIYAAQGHTRFVLAAGFRVDRIRDFADALPSAWSVDVLDTGEDTATGERIRVAAREVSDPFFATYGDGVADIDLDALLAFHRSHPGAATVTTVPLPSQYGTLETDGDGRVDRFREKPRLPEHRINAGFFVFDQRVLTQWEGADLEREVLPALARRGELYAFAHDGFWASMDTYKDALSLTELCDPGPPPWARRGPAG